ncbi:hypothetical protein BKA82DRAFT_9700 [Pisolithus tinctorius]|nr:hypothetical protein BKA82DRAFT_9700 [Pisolithus tinctorius]
MATLSHVIRSEYDPADRERFERETGQVLDGDSLTDPWQTESSFSAHRRLRAAPSFVPATIPYDEWGQNYSSQSADRPSATTTGTSTGTTTHWYRSLVRTKTSTPSKSLTPLPPRPCTVPPPEDVSVSVRKKTLREGINKNNWFIARALRSEPDVNAPSPPSSLADILTRDPPPLPSQGRYKPPVWLHIGPTNKGFAMLQRSGWSEGEGLGAHAARRTEAVKLGKEEVKDAPSLSACRDNVGLAKGKDPSVVAPERAATNVIDLTQSDSESEEEPDEDLETFEPTTMHERTSTQSLDEASAPHSQKSLLTPIPTVLKADRLGIGLKAKTEGPYKRSKKRVTHNAAALAAHIRASKEMQRKKAEVGRGSKGFARLHRREEERRKSMLAYLNG